MRKALISLILIASVGGVASQESFQCSSSNLDNAEVEISAENGRIVFEGSYCASTGGYAVTTQEISANQNEVNYTVGLTSPSDDEFVTQALTSVKFSKSVDVDIGDYNAIYSVSVDDGQVLNGSESISVEKKEIGFLQGLKDWIFGLI